MGVLLSVTCMAKTVGKQFEADFEASIPEDVYFQKCLAGMEENDCRHVGDKPIQAYNVGCMKPWIDYEPRSLKEIIENYQNIK